MLQARGVGAVVGTVEKPFRIFFLNLIFLRSVRRLYTHHGPLPLRSPTNPFFIPLHRRH